MTAAWHWAGVFMQSPGFKPAAASLQADTFVTHWPRLLELSHLCCMCVAMRALLRCCARPGHAPCQNAPVATTGPLWSTAMAATLAQRMWDVLVALAWLVFTLCLAALFCAQLGVAPWPASAQRHAPRPTVGLGTGKESWFTGVVSQPYAKPYDDAPAIGPGLWTIDGRLPRPFFA